MARRHGGWESIGVCNGMVANNLPSPRDVVSLYQSKGIGAMRIYEPHSATLKALRRTNIEVMVGVEGDRFHSLATDKSFAKQWVQKNILPYDDEVSFKYIVVGNEIDETDCHFILPAMKNMWKAICQSDLQGKIKVSAAFKSDVFTDTFPPSKTQFNPSYRMKPIVKFLAETGNPLFVNIYPYFSYKRSPNDIRLKYALFTGNELVDDPAGYKYKNLFDAMVDSVYYALEKARCSDVDVVVSESGWPSAGGIEATRQNACTYNQNLINHVVNGTPKRPGRHLETYVFAMFNENLKDNHDGQAEIERNFGLFYPNKSPVYQIN